MGSFSSDHGFWLPALIVATLYGAVPLILAAMGGILSERSGIVNIALEGMILTGAFFGAWAGRHNALLGLIVGLTAGGILGLLHGILTQKCRMNHVVSGLGINMLAAGVTRYLTLVYFPGGMECKPIDPRIYLIVALLLPLGVAVLLNETKLGLRLRACGENPESTRMAGVSVLPVRLVAVTLSGVCAALAGTFLSQAEAHTFSRDMSAGKGYIALAAVIFGKWNPPGAVLAAVLFGLFFAVQTQLQIHNLNIHLLGVEWTSPSLLDTLPYLVTLAALVSVVGKAAPPAALGKEEEQAL